MAFLSSDTLLRILLSFLSSGAYSESISRLYDRA
jgi:hypothetical protein